MDYKLKKAYELTRIPQTERNSSSNFSLASLYESILEEQKKQNLKSSSNLPTNKKPIKTELQKTTEKTPPVVDEVSSEPETVSASLYDQLIAKKLGTPIPKPVGNYKIGVNVMVHPEDKSNFDKLFPLAPPKGKVDKIEDDEVIGSKGSGNGEIALYWLLNKTYDIVDSRSSGAPDLTATIQGKQIGLEVKAYGKTGKIGLGRFGKQKSNRQLLSIVFGLKALMSSFEKVETPRMPSLDTFSADELIAAFKELTQLDNNKELKQISHKFPPILAIYQQVAFVTSSLDLKAGEYNEVKAASELMLKLLREKLAEKPGFASSGVEGSLDKGDGFIVSVSENGKIMYYSVSNAKLDDLSKKPELVLKNVNANGAALLVNLDALFR